MGSRKKNKPDRSKAYWLMRTGQFIRIVDMGTEHLRNSANLMERAKAKGHTTKGQNHTLRLLKDELEVRCEVHTDCIENGNAELSRLCRADPLWEEKKKLTRVKSRRKEGEGVEWVEW